MHHYVYKITNLITNEYYIGRLSTRYLWDHYMGSGTQIKDAIIQYGEKAFRKEILKSFKLFADSADYEHKLIKECHQDPLCYNISTSKYNVNWNSKIK